MALRGIMLRYRVVFTMRGTQRYTTKTPPKKDWKGGREEEINKNNWVKRKENSIER